MSRTYRKGWVWNGKSGDDYDMHFTSEARDNACSCLLCRGHVKPPARRRARRRWTQWLTRDPSNLPHQEGKGRRYTDDW